jgi:Flp pilus assembly protein TadG
MSVAGGGGWAQGAAANEAGVIALEFALLAPVFLLLLFGTMVFALYFAVTVAVTQGAAEGGRASIAGLTDAERAAFASQRVRQVFEGYAPLLDPDAVTVRAVPATSSTFTVEVTYPLDTIATGPLYSLLSLVTGASQTAPATVRHAVTVANGGYS